MNKINPYCKVLDIDVPRLEAVKHHREAIPYSMLIVALLERGGPMTLEEVARRFEEAGVFPADRALASLKRCKPGRPPVFRIDDHYALDPHHHESDLWAFRLGLKPPWVAPLKLIRPEGKPLPGPHEPLSAAHLNEAWRGGLSFEWSAQRTAICVLDAHGPVMRPHEVMSVVEAISPRWTPIRPDSASYWRRGAPIQVQPDGAWILDRSHKLVRSARQAVIDRIEMLRRSHHDRPDPVVMEAQRKSRERRRRMEAERLARLRRVIVHAFPTAKPEGVVLLDIGRHTIDTYLGEEIAEVAAKLNEYDVIGAVNVRRLLHTLGFDPEERRLAELEPPQKTKQLNRRGRTLRITLDLLVSGTCNISRPFAAKGALADYLRKGEMTKFRRRLEADTKSLLAFYQYGRLHHGVRLRWGFLDEIIPAPWVYLDEPALYDLMEESLELGRPLEVVVGSAPGWADPWSRARLAYVRKERDGWCRSLLDEDGQLIYEDDVQQARLVPAGG
ncbi:MAG: hypothetical protein KJ970_16475 [Candidatus Eisenbacteria bacterium]|uniref:Uncharacterized protein n=1 Tax=Eiseniibacteriota bacterium TaxID=2212470 RepID=A0A948S0D1_UNCEI|nr:hypothetical protein [Candidatus Eisenbacteria bacterium]MBU1947528.1 hypothetical protein [Candidatus Eisenbacteria bacterium]MBU2692517.1 hypothetical protein [Candidatus Eisenbacteria bacterium]